MQVFRFQKNKKYLLLDVWGTGVGVSRSEQAHVIDSILHSPYSLTEDPYIPKTAEAKPYTASEIFVLNNNRTLSKSKLQSIWQKNGKITQNFTNLKSGLCGIVLIRAGYAHAVFSRGEGFAHAQTRFLPYSLGFNRGFAHGAWY